MLDVLQQCSAVATTGLPRVHDDCQAIDMLNGDQAHGLEQGVTDEPAPV